MYRAGEDGEEEIKIDKKAVSTEMRIRMQSLYKKAYQEDILEELKLAPLVDNELSANGIKNLHVYTFTNMSKQYTSLNDYRTMIQSQMKAKEDEF